MWGSHCGNDEDSSLMGYDVTSAARKTSGGASCLHIQVQNNLGSSNPKDGSSSLLWNICVYQFIHCHNPGHLNLQNLTDTLANTVNQLSIVVPRKLRNYNFTRNNSKDSNGNEAKYLYNVLYCVPVLVNTMATSQHFPCQHGYLNSSCTMAGLLKIMNPTCSQHRLVW